MKIDAIPVNKISSKVAPPTVEVGSTNCSYGEAEGHGVMWIRATKIEQCIDNPGQIYA